MMQDFIEFSKSTYLNPDLIDESWLIKTIFETGETIIEKTKPLEEVIYYPANTLKEAFGRESS